MFEGRTGPRSLLRSLLSPSPLPAPPKTHPAIPQLSELRKAAPKLMFHFNNRGKHPPKPKTYLQLSNPTAAQK